MAIDISQRQMKMLNPEKEKRIKRYREEASRLSSMANKRVARLEKNKLKSTPAYKQYIRDGHKPFGVRGKSYNEVQKEVARLNRFLGSQTSTIRGANKVLKEVAENTGIKYKNLKELRKKSEKFFELSSKVEQYLRTVDDMASAIGYQKIWEAVNTYTKEQGIELDGSDVDVDSMIHSITTAIKDYDKSENVGGTSIFYRAD